MSAELIDVSQIGLRICMKGTRLSTNFAFLLSISQ